jgi:hypothetical protein
MYRSYQFLSERKATGTGKLVTACPGTMLWLKTTQLTSPPPPPPTTTFIISRENIRLIYIHLLTGLTVVAKNADIH